MNNYNRFINSKFVLPVLVFTLIFTSCKKEPGPGGRATIKGKVYAEYWDKYFVTCNYELCKRAGCCIRKN